MSHAALAFDTFKYVKKLKTIGISEEQAGIQAEAMKEQIDTAQEFINEKIDNTLATKQDIKGLELEIKRLEVELKQDMKRLDVKMEGLAVEMKRLEERLTDRLTARFCYMMVSGIGFLSALIVILKFV